VATQNRQKVVTKKLIPAVFPENMPQEEKERINNLSAQDAMDRAQAIAAETLIPADASITLRFRLCKHGKHLQAYAYDEKRRRWYGLLPAPSLLSSALGILESEQYRQAVAS